MISISESFRSLRLIGVTYFTFINPFSLQNMSKFEIDFFEFSFLVEACIPPVPIARSSFWDKVCNDYYHQLSANERSRLFEWISLNPRFKDSLQMDNKQCRVFWHRYNPECQYSVTTDGDVITDCFLMDGKYYIKCTESYASWVAEEKIIKVEPLIQ